MPELSTKLLRQIAEALPAGDLRNKITAMLPYHPEQLFGAQATHPEHGRVLVISAHADKEGDVRAAMIDAKDREYGSDWFYPPLNELTFHAPDTKALPRQIETVEELKALPIGTIVENDHIRAAQLVNNNRWLKVGSECALAHLGMALFLPLTVVKVGSDG
ncbi:hypothetical protein [Corynebacterium ulceribovis]|uniref:hypothetical protein n=1 Tax=Corynebacterium ulceribovis TaxID=487732 RepID=UPI00037BE781|nr:hypothetical protein [Corynebacterium ulceribovis]